MKLLRIEDQWEFEAEVVAIENKDYEVIKKSGQFEFDWEKEKVNHVFKVMEVSEAEDSEILGLISLIDIAEEFRVHINLIENSNDNKGKNKSVDRIAGCLLAFAVQVAFENGYSGFVSLVPKTDLIEMYKNKYGFSQYGRQLAIEGRAAIQLVQKYL